MQVGPRRPNRRADSGHYFRTRRIGGVRLILSVRIQEAKPLANKARTCANMAMTLWRGPRLLQLQQTPIEHAFALTEPRFTESGQYAQSDDAVPSSALIFEDYAVVHVYSMRADASGSRTNSN